MRSVSNWRSPRDAEDYAKHDAAQLAQEYLRRNPVYCDQYDAIMHTHPRDSILLKQALEGLARQWGLSFPFRPRGQRSYRPGTVGAEPVSRHCDPRYSTDGTAAAPDNKDDTCTNARQIGDSAGFP